MDASGVGRRLGLALVLTGACVTGLTGCGPGGPTNVGGRPVGYWVDGLRDPDPRVRKKAVVKLAHVGERDSAAIPALIGAVSDPDAVVRNEAVLALARLGTLARDAIPALTSAQNDRDPWVRANAARALERVQAGPRAN